jgi:predicted nucleic acid-binding protein
LILVDSSAWIDFIGRTGSSTHKALRRLIAADDDQIITTEVVHMELLAGARDEATAARLRRMLAHYELVPIDGLVDYEEAAALYRACRRQGETVRVQIDCLIAAVAIRSDAAVLHNDRDFEAIARHTALRLAS